MGYEHSIQRTTFYVQRRFLKEVSHMIIKPDFVSIREAADRLGVTYATLWRMVKEGQLPAVRVRSLVRIPTEALSELPPITSRKEEEDRAGGEV